MGRCKPAAPPQSPSPSLSDEVEALSYASEVMTNTKDIEMQGDKDPEWNPITPLQNTRSTNASNFAEGVTMENHNDCPTVMFPETLFDPFMKLMN